MLPLLMAFVDGVDTIMGARSVRAAVHKCHHVLNEGLQVRQLVACKDNNWNWVNHDSQS
jgi:hypothetical protein